MKRAIITAAMAVVPFIVLPAAAQTKPAAAQEKIIVAIVDGENIYSSDVVMLFQTLPEQYRQAGLGQMADQIVERLIEQTLISNAARKSGLTETAEVKRRIKVLSDGILQQMYLDNKIGEQLTDDARIDEYSSTQAAISLSRIELDQCRLLVQQAAYLLDTVGNKAARKQISMIKVAVAKVYQDIADRCIQLHGARGVTGDTPAARAFGKARAFRIYDGPDEVHLQTIARLEANEQSLDGLEHYLHE